MNMRDRCHWLCRSSSQVSGVLASPLYFIYYVHGTAPRAPFIAVKVLHDVLSILLRFVLHQVRGLLQLVDRFARTCSVVGHLDVIRNAIALAPERLAHDVIADVWAVHDDQHHDEDDDAEREASDADHVADADGWLGPRRAGRSGLRRLDQHRRVRVYELLEGVVNECPVSFVRFLVVHGARQHGGHVRPPDLPQANHQICEPTTTVLVYGILLCHIVICRGGGRNYIFNWFF